MAVAMRAEPGCGSGLLVPGSTCLYLQLAGSHDSGKCEVGKGVDAHDFEAIYLVLLVLLQLLQLGDHLSVYKVDSKAEQ